MVREIISIDSEKCNGCGLCVNACKEGAIQLVNGKAALIRDDYCDGLGACLPACPCDAIHITKREALPFSEDAVLARDAAAASQVNTLSSISKLAQWPCQIKLLPVEAPYFQNCRLLICADCCAYAYARVHEDFMDGRITIIGCPKLDGIDYSEKLGEIFDRNAIQDILVLRMEVPCCGGLDRAVKKALLFSGKKIPLYVVTLSCKGEILSRT